MVNDIPKAIAYQLTDNEKVLWWAKPDMKIISNHDKQYIYNILGYDLPIAFYYALATAEHGFTFFVYIQRFLMIYLAMFVGLFVFTVLYSIVRKRHTWFVITDQRAMEIIAYDVSAGSVYQRELSDIHTFEVRYLKTGADLYFSDYRVRVGSFIYDYEAKRKRILQPIRINHYKKFRLDTLHFFAIRDPEIPAQIIRERTSAKEYIDPKRKQKENN